MGNSMVVIFPHFISRHDAISYQISNDKRRVNGASHSEPFLSPITVHNSDDYNVNNVVGVLAQ